MYHRGAIVMSFEWKDCISLSEELTKRPEESCLRSSISRAYYGVWCIARNKKGYKNYKSEDKENIHWIVINAYKGDIDKTLRKVGWSLAELRKTRNDADYNEDEEINKSLAESRLILAKSILSKLEST